MKKVMIAATVILSSLPAMAETVILRSATIRVGDGDRIEEYYPVEDWGLLFRARRGNQWYYTTLPDSCSAFIPALRTTPGLRIESGRPDGAIGTGSVLHAAKLVCRIEKLIKDSPPHPTDGNPGSPAALRKVTIIPSR